MDSKTRVFFFIKDKETKEVRLPTFCGVGLGDKNSLYVYQPTITRTQTSFFRSRKNRGPGKSIRKRIRASMRRKSTKEKQKKIETIEIDAETTASTGGVIDDTTKVQNTKAANRKTSNFLTVEDSFKHLSIQEE